MNCDDLLPIILAGLQGFRMVSRPTHVPIDCGVVEYEPYLAVPISDVHVCRSGGETVKNKKGYPANWEEIAKRIKQQSAWRCERCKRVNCLESAHVLTVHHLDGDKSNCEDWNLAALCQRCHLKIQARVKMEQLFFLEIMPISGWFKPHFDGYMEWLAERAKK